MYSWQCCIPSLGLSFPERKFLIIVSLFSFISSSVNFLWVWSKSMVESILEYSYLDWVARTELRSAKNILEMKTMTGAWGSELHDMKPERGRGGMEREEEGGKERERERERESNSEQFYSSLTVH